MKHIAYLGDVHGALLPALRMLQKWEQDKGVQLDAVVQVGDCGLFLNLAECDWGRLFRDRQGIPLPTWVCPGNHEDYAAIALWQRNPDAIPNLHLMPDGEVTTIAGIRHGAIWGNFSPKSWGEEARILQSRRMVNQYGCCGPKAMHIRKSSCDRLASNGPGAMEVLISHDAAQGYQPCGFEKPMPDFLKFQLGLEPQENPGGCPGLRRVLDDCRPQYHFFGHFHVRQTLRFENPRVEALHTYNYDPANCFEVLEFDDATDKQAILPAGPGLFAGDRDSGGLV